MHPVPIKAKNPAIKPDRALSSLIKANDEKTKHTIPSANGAASYQPKATPWVCPPRDTSPEGAFQPSNQGKKPCNRASSRLIKASAPKHLSPWNFSGAWNLEFPRPIPFAPLRRRALALKTGVKPLSRQKNQQSRLIVANQGKRQKKKMPPNDHAAPPRHATHPPALDVGCSMLDFRRWMLWANGMFLPAQKCDGTAKILSDNNYCNPCQPSQSTRLANRGAGPIFNDRSY